MTDAVVFQRYSRGRPRVRGGRGWPSLVTARRRTSAPRARGEREQPVLDAERCDVGPACAGVEAS